MRLKTANARLPWAVVRMKADLRLTARTADLARSEGLEPPTF
jgi:hypothetical protein